MESNRLQTLGLPTDESGQVDIDNLETETKIYDELTNGDIIVNLEFNFVGLVVGEPIREFRPGVDLKTIVHVPTLNYSSLDVMRESQNSTKRVHDDDDELFRTMYRIASNIAYECGEDTEEVMVVSSESRRQIWKPLNS